MNRDQVKANLGPESDLTAWGWILDLCHCFCWSESVFLLIIWMYDACTCSDHSKITNGQMQNRRWWKCWNFSCPVCVYVCACVCVRVRVYVHLSVRVWVHVITACACVRVRIIIKVCVCMFVYAERDFQKIANDVASPRSKVQTYRHVRLASNKSAHVSDESKCITVNNITYSTVYYAYKYSLTLTFVEQPQIRCFWFWECIRRLFETCTSTKMADRTDDVSPTCICYTFSDWLLF